MLRNETIKAYVDFVLVHNGSPHSALANQQQDILINRLLRDFNEEEFTVSCIMEILCTENESEKIIIFENLQKFIRDFQIPSY